MRARSLCPSQTLFISTSLCQKELAKKGGGGDPHHDKTKVLSDHMVQVRTWDCVCAKEKSS